MKRCIVITYKNGSSINIDVPDLYYQNKYSKKSNKRLHSIFLKEYNKFVNAMNRGKDVVYVGKYLKFANTSVCGKDVLGIDVKELNDEIKPVDNTIYVPGVNDRVFLDLSKTQLENLITKINDTQLIENLDILLKKMSSYFNKANVEFTIKAGKKSTSTSSGGRKKKDTAQTTTTTTQDVEKVDIDNSTLISK